MPRTGLCPLQFEFGLYKYFMVQCLLPGGCVPVAWFMEPLLYWQVLSRLAVFLLKGIIISCF